MRLSSRHGRVFFVLFVLFAQPWIVTKSMSQGLPGLPAELRQQIGKMPLTSNQGTPITTTELEVSTPTVISRPPIESTTPLTSSLFTDYINRELAKLGSNAVTPFGQSLVQSEDQSFSPQVNFSIPDDYQLAPGDEVIIRIWGSFEQEVMLKVDRRGFIKPPMIGEIKVSGVAYGMLEEVLKKAYSKSFEKFELSVTMGRLRGIRVYVTGFSRAPGAYLVSNLTTLVNLVLTSGGPSSGGSFRYVELIRNGKTISRFDLYDLLLRGDKSSDLMLRPEDVIHIRPKMREAAIAGAVYRPGIYELKDEETLGSLLEMAGGLLPLADPKKFHLLSVEDRDNGFQEVAGNQNLKPIATGDLYYILNMTSSEKPSDQRQMHVRIEGQVRNPGLFLLPPGSSLPDAIDAAGGLAENAYVFGTVFSRRSVQKSQEELLEKARQDARKAIASASIRPTSSAEEALAVERQLRIVTELLAESTKVSPDGRIIMNVNSGDSRLPNIRLENGDKVLIPQTPTVVGVFGAVVNPGVFEHESQMSSEDLIELAGGLSQEANGQQTFIIAVNGQTRALPSYQTAWLGNKVVEPLPLLPGDTVFVPNNLDVKVSFSRELKDWTLILSQIVTATAAIKVLGQ